MARENTGAHLLSCRMSGWSMGEFENKEINANGSLEKRTYYY